jgi:hypothetical protein
LVQIHANTAAGKSDSLGFQAQALFDAAVTRYRDAATRRQHAVPRKPQTRRRQA